MKSRINGIGRNVKINTSDTKKCTNNAYGYLPGGTLSLIWDKLADMTIYEESKDKLGRWSSIQIGIESRVIEIITFYRIVDKTASGPSTVHAQYDEVLGEHHTTRYYRDQLLKDLEQHMNDLMEINKVQDFILFGDMNENIESTKIRNFMNKNNLVNIHQTINNIEIGQSDNTHKYGKNCIDAALCTYGVIQFIEGCQMTECDEIILNDHRGYIVDINIEEYYNVKLNEYDKSRKDKKLNAVVFGYFFVLRLGTIKKYKSMLQKNFAVRSRKKKFFLVLVQKDKFLNFFRVTLVKIFFFLFCMFIFQK